MPNWWRQIRDSKMVMQGDILKNCHVPRIIVPLTKTGRLKRFPNIVIPATVELLDAIVLTQSCDLANDKVDNVLLAPVYTLTDFQAANPKFKDLNLVDKIRTGNVVGLFLLPSHPEQFPGENHLVVDYKNIFTLPIQYLKAYIKTAGPRLRLMSNYKHRFSQSVGLFFMRVDVEEEIPELKKKK